MILKKFKKLIVIEKKIVNIIREEMNRYVLILIQDLYNYINQHK